MILTITKFFAISLCITVMIALGLIASNPPKKLTPKAGLDFSHSLSLKLSDVPPSETVAMRDGVTLSLRKYGVQSADKPLMIMVHGSGWHGMQFHHLAKGLSEDAHVLALDLRGHGAAPQRRGDIDYIGQFEDDLADVIRATALVGQKVVLLGHSSGGGLVVRFAGGAHGAMMDHAVLLAPYLGHRAETSRENSGGWAHVLTRRIVGLSMLNMFKISALNHLPVIQFNFPAQVLEGDYAHTITQSYSYRLNSAYAPRWDYQRDIAALPEFSVIVGSKDEAFFAEKYQPTMQAQTSKGRYQVIAGASHLSVVDAPETLSTIQEELRDL